MPIFQSDLDLSHDHDEPPPPDAAIHSTTLNIAANRLRRLSEESIRTELCEGPIPDSPRQAPRTPSPQTESEPAISDRTELIERLKRGESPTWIPNRHVNRLALQNPDSSPKRPRTPNDASSLLPPAEITPEKKDDQDGVDQRVQDGLSIERPRSALHSGNFTEEESPVSRRHERVDQGHEENRSRGPPAQETWIATSPPRHFTPFRYESRIPFSGSADSFRSGYSPLSSSLSSSFVYQPPTSPLVQSLSNEEVDQFVPLEDIDFSGRNSWRRHSAASSPFFSSSPRPSLPSRAHQPRKSLTSIPSFSASGASPQSPAFLRSRRSSFADSSPLHHASMVGSYEESILRGRMSTTPSKPLDFLAQIGVLGRGKCKSSLRCPPHVTLSFPAVYYSYGNTPHGRTRSEDGPSPYVGQIDLENGLPNTEEEQRSKRKVQSRYGDRRLAEDEMDMMIPTQDSDPEHRRSSRGKRRSGSPKAPPGGSYRIPEKGQIQIVIKNPNKTAVKLFLVPYDLSGMEPGTKTFIRQRSYSAGPIIDNIPPASELDSSDRPILRYLVHLHICSPSRGRFYLYKSIRIVFANRVPDGKEKLRNETTCPEPRFTPYKPVRVMNPTPTPGPGASLAADKAFRRRSAGFTHHHHAQTFDLDSVYQHHGPVSAGFAAGNTRLIDPIPFHLPQSNTSRSPTTMTSPSQASRPSTNDSTDGPALYEKLNKGDLGYGGGAGNGVVPGAEGLLSQRLRGLGVRGQELFDGTEGEDV